MKNKFKVGDIIYCINNALSNGPLVLLEKYTVASTSDTSVLLKETGYWQAHWRFWPVAPYKQLTAKQKEDNLSLWEAAAK